MTSAVTYREWPHHVDGHQHGAYIECASCGVGRRFVSNGPLASWKRLHAAPGLFGCSTLRGGSR